MPLTSKSSLITRVKRDLPPAAPLPAALQTLGCRIRPLAYIERCRTRLGERFTVYPIDMPPLVFLSNPHDIRTVVSSPANVLHPGAGSAIIAPLIGERAFILCEEDEHLCARNATLPAFHHKIVAQHNAMVAEIASREIASWPLDRPFASHPFIRALTLKAVLGALFAGESETTLNSLQQRTLAMLSITETFLLQEPRLRHLPGWRTTWGRFVTERAHVEAQIFALIAHRRDEDEGRGDLLDMLIAAQNPDGTPMTDRQVHDHLMSMIVAGHETTAAEVAWAFQLLAHHRSIQDRLIDEIDTDSSETYLTATLLETMRRRPSFMFAVPREVVQPIEIAGWTYPPGTHLVPCTYLMHHNPDLYPEPHAFRPERFIDETPQAGTWLPWGAGRKRCIGRHFALLEMKAVLRAALSTRTVQPANQAIESPRWRSAILVPGAGSRIIMRNRPRTARQPLRKPACSTTDLQPPPLQVVRQSSHAACTMGTQDAVI